MAQVLTLTARLQNLAAKRRRTISMASTLSNLLYHIVFSTKNREPIITSPIRKDLYAYMGGIIRGEGGTLLEIGGTPDHVHLVFTPLVVVDQHKPAGPQCGYYLNQR